MKDKKKLARQRSGGTVFPDKGQQVQMRKNVASLRVSKEASVHGARRGLGGPGNDKKEETVG